MTRNRCRPISDASNKHRRSFPWPYWRAWWIKYSRAVFLNRRPLASIIPGRERP